MINLINFWFLAKISFKETQEFSIIFINFIEFINRVFDYDKNQEILIEENDDENETDESFLIKFITKR